MFDDVTAAMGVDKIVPRHFPRRGGCRGTAIAMSGSGELLLGGDTDYCLIAAFVNAH